MTCVVSDEEKAPSRRQVGIRKANASESLMKCRKTQYVTSKPGRTSSPGMSLAVTRLLARWCPAWRRREPGLRLLHGTWEGGGGVERCDTDRVADQLRLDVQD